MPDAFFLVPGYGAQGGTAADVMPCFNRDGYGAIISSSRGIIGAEDPGQAAIEMRDDVLNALSDVHKLPEGW